MDRHQINSFEFESWMEELEDWVIAENSREKIYDFWVGGYSQWEVEGILG